MKYIVAALLIISGGTLHAQDFAKASPRASRTGLSFRPSTSNRGLSGLPGERMRNTGRTLTILGSALLIGGIAVVSSAEDPYYTTTYSNNVSYEEGDPAGAMGVLMIAGGAGMMVPGIIFWSKGSKKYKSALKDNPEASLHFRGNGLAIRYRF